MLDYFHFITVHQIGITNKHLTSSRDQNTLASCSCSKFWQCPLLCDVMSSSEDKNWKRTNFQQLTEKANVFRVETGDWIKITSPVLG